MRRVNIIFSWLWDNILPKIAQLISFMRHNTRGWLSCFPVTFWVHIKTVHRISYRISAFLFIDGHRLTTAAAADHVVESSIIAVYKICTISAQLYRNISAYPNPVVKEHHSPTQFLRGLRPPPLIPTRILIHSCGHTHTQTHISTWSRNLDDVCWSLAVLADSTASEQRRVQAGATVVLPCHAAAAFTAHSSVDSDDAAATTTSGYFLAHLQRRRRTDWATREVARQKLRRHNRRVSREPAWQYEWYRDDEPIQRMSGRFSVDNGDHSLVIRNASSSTDTAVFTCVRRRRSNGNSATKSSADADDVVTTLRQIQLVVEGSSSQHHARLNQALSVLSLSLSLS